MMAGVSPRLPYIDDYERPPSRRLEVIEDRLLHQEKTTSSLIDRAFKIKEDIIDTLNLTHGTWQGEKQSRELLQEHIRTITLVVKRLSREIEILEDQVRDRDNTGATTNRDVKTLEIHHVGNVVDLRGRVARCDASIARLSADLRTVFETVSVLNRQLQENNSAVMSAIRRLDHKITSMDNRIDNTSVQHITKITSVEGESSTAVKRLDSKTMGHLQEIKSTLEATKKYNDTERDRLARQFVQQLEVLQTMRDAKQDKFEDRMDARFQRLEKRIEVLENAMSQDRETAKRNDSELRRYWEVKLDQRQEHFDKRLLEEMEKMRIENRRGFQNAHDSISTTKNILDSKRKMLAEQMHKEIRSIKKMVVLV
ncbi:protein FAM81A-like [Saccoglossus kowalevskii]|uniref:Protein FAM81A-like n=1 Tax=Saccoglossus kowalevskii TaxID=10224 RepID=A0ABM0ME96_SACKO|nr:PREDICTED: protein FAM81A-like [Saccoglossus kowalevskii]